MVFKLKEFQENSPGIIIFSHKEFIKYSQYKTFNKVLKEYKNNYFFAVHWGASFENTSEYNFENIDINFCYPEQLPDLENQDMLPYTTRSFIPSTIFNNATSKEKEIDLITVTRKVNAKYNRDLFNISKELILVNPNVKITILVANPNYVKTNYDHLFNENFEEILGAYKNSNVKLIKFDEIPKQEIVADYLKRSKVFLFTSRKEGVAKVTAEAALCNLPVLINSNFFGGARVGINTKFLLEYDSVKTAVTKINQILNLQNSNGRTSEIEVATDSLNDIKNLRNLHKDLQIYFDRKGKSYSGDLDENNLKNRMNSFLKELPDLYVFENNDLKSIFAFSKYFQNLCIGDFKQSKSELIYDRILNLSLNLSIKDIIFKLSPVWFIKIIRRRTVLNNELSYE
tara:strand:- start:12929 stop:14125 length:1197 start_codon:yes stop_codon:yes gene_type:complete